MAGPTVPYICDFSDEQRKIFESLEVEFRDKWNLTLRWDSRVPKQDRCFYYFFTMRSLDREKIMDDMREFERQFGEIRGGMEQVRSGSADSLQNVRRSRERFEDVLQTVRETINSTDSSTMYKAASDVLRRSEKVMRYFDNAEIVHSRRELRDKRTEMDEFRREYEDLQRRNRTLSNSLDESTAAVQEHERTIERLRRQLADSQESNLSSNEVINDLVQRMNRVALQPQNLMAFNSTNDKLDNLAHLLDNSKVNERRRDEKIQNLEGQLRDSTEEILREIHKLVPLMSRLLSRRNGNNQKETNKQRQDSSGITGLITDVSNASLNTRSLSRTSEQTRDEKTKSAENMVREIIERNQEMREECENLMQIVDQSLSLQSGGNPEGQSEIVTTLLQTVTQMFRKINSLSSSFEDSIAREIRRNNKIEDLESQIRVSSEQILEEIRKLTQLMKEIP